MVNGSAATVGRSANSGLVASLGRRDSARMKAYAENLAFYEGRQWVGASRRRERRLVFNYARALVEKVASYTFSGVGYSVEGEGREASAARVQLAEGWLERVGEENELAQLDFDTLVDASVLGDGAYRVVWDVDLKRVVVTAVDVQGLYVWLAANEQRRPIRVAQRYDVLPEDATLYTLGVFGRAAGTSDAPLVFGRTRHGGAEKPLKVVELWDDATFELWVDGELREQKRNPYGFIPYVVFPNVRLPKRFWGVSDLEAIRETQRELNRAISQLSRIMEVSGNPIAVLENVDKAADIAVQPGAVWEMPLESKAYLIDLLQGGGVRLHVDYVDLLYRTLHDLGESPRTAFGDSGRNLSGVALEVELEPMLQKVDRKRSHLGVALRRRNWMIFELLTRFGGVDLAGLKTRVSWSPVLPSDKDMETRLQVSLASSGVHSRRRAGQVLQVEDPEGEFERWLVEERQMAAARGAPARAVAPDEDDPLGRQSGLKEV
jgi:hypothetical protein